MGCGVSFFQLLVKRYKLKTRTSQAEAASATVFPRRISSEVFDYVDVSEPSRAGPCTGQQHYTPSAAEYMNMRHKKDVKRLFGISPYPWTYQPTVKPKNDPLNPVPKPARALENKLDYKPPPALPVNEVHRTTKYVVTIYSDDSDSDISVADMKMCVSKPIDIPGRCPRSRNYGGYNRFAQVVSMSMSSDSESNDSEAVNVDSEVSKSNDDSEVSKSNDDSEVSKSNVDSDVSKSNVDSDVSKSNVDSDVSMSNDDSEVSKSNDSEVSMSNHADVSLKNDKEASTSNMSDLD